MKAFKKGDKVTLIQDWNGKGTAFYMQAVVYSCGTKQMVLTSEDTGDEIGNHFKPVRVTEITTNERGQPYYTYVFNRLTDEEASAACLVLGRIVLECEC